MVWFMVLCWLGSGVEEKVTLRQPEARRVDVVDTIFGEKVADPYRWMEDQSSEETTKWVLEQDAYTRRFVKVQSSYDQIGERMDQISRSEAWTFATVGGDYLFFAQNSRGVGMVAVWVRKKGQEHARQLFHHSALGPDQWLAAFKPSPDGSLVAVTSAGTGSRDGLVRFFDVEKGTWSKPELTEISIGFSGLTWLDNQTLIYDRAVSPQAASGNPAKNIQPKGIYLHRVGQDQALDQVFYKLPDHANRFITHWRSKDGRWLVLRNQKGMDFQYSAVDLQAADRELKLLYRGDTSDNFLDSYGDKLVFQTRQGAPFGRIIALDPARPGQNSWTQWVAESRVSITSAFVGGDYVLMSGNLGAKPMLQVYSIKDGTLRDLPMSHMGLMTLFSGRPGSQVAFASLTNVYDPGSIYRLDLAAATMSVVQPATTQYPLGDYTIEQRRLTGPDGHDLSVFLCHRKDLPRDRPQPVLLYGYGAGNWSAFPWYQPHIVTWMDMGGIYAVANIRGGGEYGEAWFQAGIKRQKQNAIDDFIAVGNFLLKEGVTTRDQLAGNGGSASGPLIAAALLQQPELFAAALVEYPTIDMVRFTKRPTGQFIIWANGDPEDPDDFASLYKWSPYHRVKEGQCYPATMLVLGEKDMITPPFHGYKFQAALQRAMGCERPVLTRMVWNGSHYQYGLTREQSVQTWTDILAFLEKSLKVKTRDLRTF